MTLIDELNHAFNRLDALMEDNVQDPIRQIRELHHIALLQQQQLADQSDRIHQLENHIKNTQ